MILNTRFFYYLISSFLFIFLSLLIGLEVSYSFSNKSQHTDFTILSNTINSFQDEISKNNVPLIKNKIKTLIENKKKLGTDNIYILSSYLISVADQFLSKKKIEEALLFLNASILISPDFYLPRFKQASIQIKNFDILKGISSICKGLSLYIKTYNYFLNFHIFSLLTLSVFLSFLITFFFLFVLNLKNIIKDIDVFLFIAVFASLISFIAPGGELFILLILPVLLWGYGKNETKAAIAIFFIFLLLVPSFLGTISRSAFYSNSKLYNVLHNLTKNTWDENGFRILNKKRKRLPENWMLDFSLGFINKKKGNFSEALYLYKRVLKRDIKDPGVFVNVGNSLIFMGEIEESVKYYKRAKEIDSNFFEAYINLGKAWGELGRIDDASKEFSKALKIDSIRSADYMNRDVEHYNQDVIDSPLSSEAFRKLDSLFKKDLDSLYNDYWTVFLGKVTYNQYFLYLFFSISFIGLIKFYILRKDGFSYVCTRCGVIFKNSSGEYERDLTRCNNCDIVDFHSKKIDSLMKKEVEKKIKVHQLTKRNVSIILNFIFPGLGLIVFHHVVYGIANMFFSFIILLEILYNVSLVRTVFFNNLILILWFIIGSIYFLICNMAFIKNVTKR